MHRINIGNQRTSPDEQRNSRKFSQDMMSSRINLAIATVSGMCIGAALKSNFSFSNVKPTTNTTWKGVVKHLADVPDRPTSHIDTQGRPITKQQLLEPFVVPNFVGYSVATFKPGQNMMPVHEHESMHEFFYVLEGRGVIQINNVDHNVEPGTFLHMAPKEKHGIWIPENEKDDMKMAVCGVTVD